MSLTTEMQQKIFESLDDGYTQVKFFQDDVVVLDNDKSDWDNAIFKVDSELYGEIQIVNRAIDDVKDAYQDHFTGVTSCRSDLIWVATNHNTSPTPSLWNFVCVKLNENGYTAMMNQLAEDFPGGNLVGVGSTFFYYLDPSDPIGLVTTSPTNAVTGAEQVGVDR